MEQVATSSECMSPPVHVAIIMDGNGRWAQKRKLPRTAGHRQGAESVRRALRAAGDNGVRYLTLFGFSSENWSRPESEIEDLMGLLRVYLRSEIAELQKNNIRLKVIGERDRLADDIVRMIEQAERTTAANTGLTFLLALSYGGRRDITQAARALARDAAAGRIEPDAIDETAISERLLTAGIPEPDLLIRTSGEKRISNFLIWQIAYTELVFLDVLWPDFDERCFADALEEFQRRERRYGATVNSN